MLRMITGVYQNNENPSIPNNEVSIFNISLLLYLAVILHNQKLIDKINKESKK